MFDYIML